MMEALMKIFGKKEPSGKVARNRLKVVLVHDRINISPEIMENMRNDIVKMLVINAGFHQIIYEASKSRMLQKLLTSLQTYLKYKNPDVVYTDNYLSVILKEHRAIFKAFKDNDPREGGRAMEIHINRAKERRCG